MEFLEWKANSKGRRRRKKRKKDKINIENL